MNKNRENGVQLPFTDENFIQKWQEWLQYRKERRLPSYVPTGLKGTFTKLKRISQNDPVIAMQIIDQSIENNWQGLFELKISSNAANLPNPTAGNKQTNGNSSSARINSIKNF